VNSDGSIFFQAIHPQGIDFHYQEITKNSSSSHTRKEKAKRGEHRLMLVFKELLQNQPNKNKSRKLKQQLLSRSSQQQQKGGKLFKPNNSKSIRVFPGIKELNSVSSGIIGLHVFSSTFIWNSVHNRQSSSASSSSSRRGRSSCSSS
jgi:hypothetical protein